MYSTRVERKKRLARVTNNDWRNSPQVGSRIPGRHKSYGESFLDCFKVDWNLKWAVSRYFCYYFISRIEAIYAPNKQSKMVLLKNSFCEDIREISDSPQC